MLRIGWLAQGLDWHRGPATAPQVHDPAGLPPMLIQAGDQELLLADAELLATRAHAAGVACTFEVHPARWHVFHLQAAYLASARAALRTMADIALAHAGALAGHGVVATLGGEPAEIAA